MHHPLRMVVGMGGCVALTSAGLVGLGLGLQPQPPSADSQIRAVVDDQVRALNNRDVAELAQTYCSSDARTLTAQAASSMPPGAQLRVQSVDHITVTGSVATAHVVLAAPTDEGRHLQLSPTGITNRFERTASGEWQMCSGTAPGTTSV